MDQFKNNIIAIFLVHIVFLFAIESNPGKVNNKFSYIDEIYSESWALVIGINKYHNIERLNYAVNDAMAVQRMLVDKYGFKDSNIKLILDEEATKDNILQGFSDILSQSREKDRVVVFYAGHGETYKLPSGGDMGYLIPVDGDLDNLYMSSIPMKSVYDIAEMSYAKHILYLVDACYGGLTLNTRGIKKDQTPEYLKQMTRERGRQVITAGGKDEQVQERPEWGHSAFTRNLLKGLGEGLADENLDGVITGDELGGFIKNRVIVDVDGAHTPQKGRIGSDMGEFVFISETIDTQIAEGSSSFEGEQIDNLESEVAELKKLLKSRPKNRSNVRKKLETAKKLAWAFPGLGHYYNGDYLKGLTFSSLELLSLSLLISNYIKYTSINQDYNNALLILEDPQSFSTSDLYVEHKNYTDQLLNNKNGSIRNIVISGSAAISIWMLNTYSIKKNSRNVLSASLRFKILPHPYIKFTIPINLK